MSDMDETELTRRERQEELERDTPTMREDVVARHGEAWSTDELQRDFEVLGFMAPFVVVRRRSDGQVGSMEFQHSPRWYFGWSPD